MLALRSLQAYLLMLVIAPLYAMESLGASSAATALPPGMESLGAASATTSTLPSNAANAIKWFSVSDKVHYPSTFGFMHPKDKLPSAILLFLPDEEADVNASLGNSAWQDYAANQRLGMTVVTGGSLPPPAKNQPATRNLPTPGSYQAAVILRTIDQEFGAGVPLFLYSGSQQADVAEYLLTTNPKRIRGWYLDAPGGFRDAGINTPPGILVCHKENKSSYEALLADFAKARKLGARVTWIATEGDHPTKGQTDELGRFVRDYYAMLLNPKPQMEQWLNIDTKGTVSSAETLAKPAVASYLPHAALTASWAALHVPGGPTLFQQTLLEREIDTFNPAQPKLRLYLRKPTSANAPNKPVTGILAYSTWYNDRNKLLSVIQNPHDYLVRYAEEHRLALLTWNVAEAFDNVKNADERNHAQNFNDNLSFQKLADAWERGVHALCHESGLSEADILLFGQSRGAQWAHRLALRKPEHFLAVHIHVNSTYDLPTPAAKNILWLQTTGEREYGYNAALRFYARCRQLGYPILFKAGENLGHSSSPQIEEIGRRFFDYVLQVKSKRDEGVARAARSSFGKVSPPDLYALSGLRSTPYYADLINQEVYTADQQDMVPSGQRVPLPTKALAQAWGPMATSPALMRVDNAGGVTSPAAPALTAAGTQPSYFGTREPVSLPSDDAASLAADQPPAPDPATIAATSQPPGKEEERQETRSASSIDQAVDGREYARSVKQALEQGPSLSQADNALDSALLDGYRRLKGSNSSSPADDHWSERVVDITRLRASRPNYQKEFQDSIGRAVTLCPSLAQADSPTNTAFIAEYHHLRETADPKLADPNWPEHLAREIVGRTNVPR